MKVTGADGKLIPVAFVAVTVQVYEVPFVSAVNRMGEFALEAEIAPGPHETV